MDRESVWNPSLDFEKRLAIRLEFRRGISITSVFL